MKTNSASSALSLKNSQPDRPQISHRENQQLPRHERIYNYLMWPKHFNLTDADEKQLQRMQMAYNILIEAPTDMEARAKIKAAILGVKLTLSEVLELIWETKALFGKISFRNSDFDRAVLRQKLIELARRAKKEGDLKQERLAYADIIRLDGLEQKEKDSGAPVIPQLPNVRFTNVQPQKKSEHDLAIIESTPADEEE